MAEAHDEKTPHSVTQAISEETPHPAIQSTDIHNDEIAPKPRTKLEKLGTYNIIVLILGSIAILVPMAFLAFFWAASTKQNLSVNNDQPRVWIDIVGSSWTTKTITMAVVVMRAAIAAQLCVFAAIMAALILERAGGTSTADFPLLSMIRCANNGPQALIWHVFHTITTGTQLRYSIIIILAILNAVALQFTSTILLLDVKQTDVILGQWTDHYIPVGYNTSMSNSPFLEATDYWKSSFTTLPLFAEYSDQGSSGSDYIDTGKMYRGFLPYQNSTTRTTMRKYEGPMLVTDQRVLCVKPNISQVTAWYGAPTDKKLLNGSIPMKNIHPDIKLLNDTLPIFNTSAYFNCSLPVQDPKLPPGWLAASLCPLYTFPIFWMKGGLFGNDTPGWDWEDEVLKLHGLDLNYGFPWLFMTISNTTNYYDQNTTGPNVTEPGLDKSTYYWKEDTDTRFTTLPRVDSPEGPWAQFGQDSKEINLSICFWQPSTNIFKARAEGNPNFDRFTSFGGINEEPSIFWNGEAFDTSEAQLQLNSLNASDPEQKSLLHSTLRTRGLLGLTNSANWAANLSRLDEGDGGFYLGWEALKIDSNLVSSDTTHQLSDSNGGDAESTPATLMALAQATLHDPAKTLQSLTHVVLQQAYFEWLGSWDSYKQANVHWTEKRAVPTRWLYFGIITGLLVLHLALVAIAVVLFLTRTEMSLLGNAWHVVAQCHSDDTAQTVEKGYMLTDKELMAAAKGSGSDVERLRIGRSVQGRNVALRYSRNPQSL